jgi:bacillithiol system protein YtxJ
VTPYFLDLLNYREISNEIASRFDIHHESPQVVVLKDGKAVHSASHNEIDQADFA